MKNNLPLAFCMSLLLLTCRTTPANAQAPPADGAQQFADLGDLKLQGGGVIQDFNIGIVSPRKCCACRMFTPS